jgi:hypothetical protein
MSVRSDARVCRHCGMVDLVARMVKLNAEGEYEYACQGCAVREGARRA